MNMNDSTVLADLERLGWWAMQTLRSDRQELRVLFRAWRDVSGVTVPNSLIGEMADLIASQSALQHERVSSARPSARMHNQAVRP